MAGSLVSRTLVVCNDSETPRTIDVRWEIGANKLGRLRLALAPAAQERCTVQGPAPAATLFVEASTEGLAPARGKPPWLPLAVVSAAALQLRQLTHCTDPRKELTPHLANLGLTTQPNRASPPSGKDRRWIIARRDGVRWGIRT